MKSLAFVEHVVHDRKAAIYAAAHDGKLRNFVYHEELGECRETFARLLQDVQKGEIGVVMTPDAACLSIETSQNWMEAFIQVVKQHEVLIGDHSHDLVEVEKKAQDTPIYCLSSGARGKDADMWGIGPLKDLLDSLALYGVNEGDGWSPVHTERKGWLSRIQQQEDAMAAQTAAALQPHWGSLPKGARQVSVILPGRGKARGKQRGKRGGRNR